MTKNKKIGLILTGIACGLAIIAIFMGFAAGVKATITEAGVKDSETYKLFDLLFKKEWKDGLKRVGVAISAFAALLVGILAIGTNVVLNLIKKSNKTINTVMLTVAIVLLVYSAAVMFAIAPVLGFENQSGEDFKVTFGPGAGAAVWGTFSILAAGLCVATNVLNSKEPKVAQAA